MKNKNPFTFFSFNTVGGTSHHNQLKTPTSIVTLASVVTICFLAVIGIVMYVHPSAQYDVLPKNGANNNHNKNRHRTNNFIDEKDLSPPLYDYPAPNSRKLLSQEQQRRLRDITVRNNVYDVAIVGAGPAGLTAALFAARAGLNVIVLGSSAGMLSQTPHLDNFPSYYGPGDGGGPGWLDITKRQALQFGAQFAPPGLLVTSVTRKVGGKNEPDGPPSYRGDDDDDTTYFTLHTPAGTVSPAGDGSSWSTISAWSIIVATGSTSRRLGLPREDTLWGTSIHSCALCDGHLYDASAGIAGTDGKLKTHHTTTVVVVGGGDAAIDAAIFLARYATKVIIVHRRDEFSSARNQVNLQLLHTTANIEIVTPYIVQEWIVDEDNDPSKLIGVKIHNTHDLSESRVLDKIDGAFIMIGATPNTGWIAQQSGTDLGLDLDEEGLIRLAGGGGGAAPTTTTTAAVTASSVSGIFACGEVTDTIYKQAITAAASGAQAAIDAERWLRERLGVSRRHVKLSDEIGREGQPQQQQQPPPNDQASIVDKSPPLSTLDGQDNEADRNDNCDLTTPDCITSIVQRYPVVVFSKSWCPYCRKALEALALAGVENPHIIDVSQQPRINDVQATLQQMTGRRTVPNVFVGGTSIGGGDETSALQQQGKLLPLLMAAEAIAPSPNEDIETERGLSSTGEAHQAKHGSHESDGGTGKEDCDLASEECFREVLKKYPVVMFSLSWCPECKRSLELLDLLGVHPHIVDLDDYKPISENIRQHMLKMTDRRQVPNLFVGGEYVGGHKRTATMHERGELIPLFQKVGVL